MNSFYLMIENMLESCIEAPTSKQDSGIIDIFKTCLKMVYNNEFIYLKKFPKSVAILKRKYLEQIKVNLNNFIKVLAVFTSLSHDKISKEADIVDTSSLIIKWR